MNKERIKALDKEIVKRTIVERRVQRIEWLRDHPKMWENWQGNAELRKRQVVEAMQADRMVARATYWKDVNITSMIEEIFCE